MIDVHVDAKGALAYIGALGGQFNFAASVALNRTAEDANASLRRVIPKEFTVREKQILNYVAPLQLPRPNRATKQNLSAILEAQGKGHILDPFEVGKPKVQKSADSPVAVPTQNIRFTKRTEIPRKWYPVNLGLTPRRDPTGSTYYALGKGAIKNKATPFKRAKSGAIQVQGKNRTFVLDPRWGHDIDAKARGVYVRVGPRREDIRFIWSYRDKVQRPPILKFEQTIERTVRERWTPNFEGALAYALRTAL